MRAPAATRISFFSAGNKSGRANKFRALHLINRRNLMSDHVNTLTFNIIAWGSSILMITLTLVLMYVSIFEPSAARLSGSLLSIFH